MSSHSKMSIQVLEERLQQKPASLLFSRLADSYRKNGNVQEAISVCIKGLEYHPNYATGRIILGRCYLEQENIKDAIEQFSEVCKLDRRNQLAIKMLGDIYSQQDMGDKAGNLYSILLDMDPENQSLIHLVSVFKCDKKRDIYEILGLNQSLGERSDPQVSESPGKTPDETKVELSPEVNPPEVDNSDMLPNEMLSASSSPADSENLASLPADSENLASLPADSENLASLPADSLSQQTPLVTSNMEELLSDDTPATGTIMEPQFSQGEVSEAPMDSQKIPELQTNNQDPIHKGVTDTEGSVKENSTSDTDVSINNNLSDEIADELNTAQYVLSEEGIQNNENIPGIDTDQQADVNDDLSEILTPEMGDMQNDLASESQSDSVLLEDQNIATITKPESTQEGILMSDSPDPQVEKPEVSDPQGVVPDSPNPQGVMPDSSIPRGERPDSSNPRGERPDSSNPRGINTETPDNSLPLVDDISKRLDSMFGEESAEIEEDFSGQYASVSSDIPVQTGIANRMSDTPVGIDVKTPHSTVSSASEKADNNGTSNDLSSRVEEMFGIEDKEVEALVSDESITGIPELSPEITPDFDGQAGSDIPEGEDIELKEIQTNIEDIAVQESAALSVTPVEEEITPREFTNEILPDAKPPEEIPVSSGNDLISEGERSGIEGLSESVSSEPSVSDELPVPDRNNKSVFTEKARFLESADSSDRFPVEDESQNIDHEEPASKEVLNQAPIPENTEETENIMKESTTVIDREIVKDIASTIVEDTEELEGEENIVLSLDDDLIDSDSLTGEEVISRLDEMFPDEYSDDLNDQNFTDDISPKSDDTIISEDTLLQTIPGKERKLAEISEKFKDINQLRKDDKGEELIKDEMFEQSEVIDIVDSDYHDDFDMVDSTYSEGLSDEKTELYHVDNEEENQAGNLGIFSNESDPSDFPANENTLAGIDVASRIDEMFSDDNSFENISIDSVPDEEVDEKEAVGEFYTETGDAAFLTEDENIISDNFVETQNPLDSDEIMGNSSDEIFMQSNDIGGESHEEEMISEENDNVDLPEETREGISDNNIDLAMDTMLFNNDMLGNTSIDNISEDDSFEDSDHKVEFYNVSGENIQEAALDNDRLLISQTEEKTDKSDELAFDSQPKEESITLKSKESGEDCQYVSDRADSIPDHVLTPTLADIYFQQNQPYLAVQIYKRLFEMNPENEHIEKRIKEIEQVIKEQEEKREEENLGSRLKNNTRKYNSKAKKKDNRPLKGKRIKKKIKERIKKIKK